ncbi:MAG: FAD-dependent oxidoreductase [Wenzhouxiangellaceae bacterium]
MSVVPPDINHTFSEEDLEALAAYGEVRRHGAEELLVEEGQRSVDCLVTLSGETHIFVETQSGPNRVGWMERGQFAGDISVLTGQGAIARVIMGKEGEVLHIPHDRFQQLMVENSHLSDIFLTVLSARREFGRTSGNAAVFVLGGAHDRTVFAARDLLSKHGVPHHWMAPDVDPVAKCLIESRQIAEEELPAVIIGRSKVLSRPSVDEIAEALGLDLVPDGYSADVIVVGSGPGGLAASVYAASEGLSVVTLDADGPGGQAGTSSKIENYLGFPGGVSGRELSERAALQAQKFGARMASPAKAARLEKDDDYYCLKLRDGRSMRARAIVIATGAQYRRLPIENLERYEGRGIYYGATPMEAQLCQRQEVAIVGAGNSAGQGAVFLSRSAKVVHVVYRRPDIRETMSEYLVRRLEETQNIHLHPSTEIEQLHGVEGADPQQDRLTAASWRNNETGEVERCDTAFIFLFVGAAPFTDWLPETLSCDNKGFLKTGPDIQNLDLVRAGWTLDRMPTRFETSWPRIYAVGDVRAGSIKRVASAVGEGSVVISDVHQALSEMETRESEATT